MPSRLHRKLSLCAFAFSVLLISPAASLTCTSQTFASNDLYPHCLDLPTLTAFLHYSYNSANSTLSVAFFAPPSKPGGWIAWAINPTGTGMAGAQSLVAYRGSNGVVTFNTYDVASYGSIVQSKLSFDVWDTKAEEVNGVIRLFAKLKVPADLAAKGTVNQVWQAGPAVGANGALAKHEFLAPNLNAKAMLDLNGARGGVIPTSAGGGDSRLKKKNIHGILNGLSWGILFPLGVIIARYVKTFESADPAWFYLHVSCQLSAYVLGVAGWATGLKLGSESKGFQFTAHRNIGIALFCLATIQIFALFLRPKKDHKYRLYWNIYHHGIGYSVIILGIFNVFKGLNMLKPGKKWESGYIAAIATLGGIALFLEAVTWIIVIRRKSSLSSKA